MRPRGEERLDNRHELDRFLASVETRAFRIALYRLGNRDDALDVVQDAMMSLAQRYAKRPASEWPPLFYRILTNRIRDWVRRARVRRLVTPWQQHDPLTGIDAVETAPDPLERDPERDTRLDAAIAALARAVETLAPRQQEALLLRLVEGLNVAQTATAMRCTEGSVKTHYSRAVHALRAQLGEHWP